MFEVKESRLGYGVGIIILLLGILLFVLELFHHIGPIPLWIYMAVLAICVFGLFLCIRVRNRKLIVDRISNEEFTYVNLIKKGKKFGFKDIGYIKAGISGKIGRDFLIIFNKQGEKLCKLECSMENADKLLQYLHDKDITIDMMHNSDTAWMSIVYQEPITEEQRKKIVSETYEKTAVIIKEWLEKNYKIGAQLEYGLAEYYGNRIDETLEIQKQECRYIEKEVQENEIPPDYLCVMELYVKKDGYFVRDRKKQLLAMSFPVIYKKKSAAEEEQYRLYCNRNYENELEEGLEVLTKYLPGHKFIIDSMQLGYELKKEI